MIETFENADALGKEFLDSGLKSFATVSKGAQAISDEASGYVRKALETGNETIAKFLSAKSVEKAIEIQTDYARQAYEGFVAETTKMAELYADMAKDAYRPFESVVARTR